MATMFDFCTYTLERGYIFIMFGNRIKMGGDAPMLPNVADIAKDLTARAVASNIEISPAKLQNAAEATLYLISRDLRLPLTLEQARELDAEARRQTLALCSVLKKLDQLVAQCERAIEVVALIDKSERDFAPKRAQAPICGWENEESRSIYTKTQWRRAATIR